MMQTLNQEQIAAIFQKRQPNTYKGDYGRILLLCGSRGYTGAAALSAMGALRTGAGVVYLGVPSGVYDIVATKLWEPVVLPLPDENGRFSTATADYILPMLNRMDAVLIGPGLGVSQGVFHLVQTILKSCNKPVVLDADGINVLSAHKDILRDRCYPTIVTPHDGEFCRLGGQLTDNRMESAEALAKELQCIVLLKGHRTVITDGISTYINETGNPGMATGGSGDVLAGIIVSLLGQGLEPLLAAACGAWLHGSAGDLCAKEIGQYGMLPQDMLNALPRLLP